MGIFGGMRSRPRSFMDLTGISPDDEAELRRQMEMGGQSPGQTPPYAPTMADRIANDTTGKASAGGIFGKAGRYEGAPRAAGIDPAQPQQPQGMNPRLAEMVGSAPKKRSNTGPIIASVLGAVASGLQYANGDSRGGDRTISALSAGLAQRRKDYLTQMADFERRKQIASLPGMNEREMAAYMANPDQWGSQMSNALATHHAAANVGQSETRVFGNPNEGGSTYQPPRLIENGVDTIRYDPQTGQAARAYQGMTQGEQYARSLGKQPGSKDWMGAVQDQQLGTNGPTAMEARQGLEGIRQDNRLQLRNIPQARVPSAPPRPRAPSPSSVIGGVLQKFTQGAPLTDGEQKLLERYQAGGRGGAGGGRRGPPAATAQPQYKEGDVVSNAQGQRMVLRNNAWVPVR